MFVVNKSILPVVLALSIFSPPAAAAVLKQGDILYALGGGVARYDPITGTREVISGCADWQFGCNGNPAAIVGTGPLWDVPTAALAQPDGSVVVFASSAAYRVDPSTGNRALLAHPGDGGLPLGIGFSVVPFFSPSVAALPQWGIPLAIGLFVGLVVRRVPAPAQHQSRAAG
jgi:hypothetical protein